MKKCLTIILLMCVMIPIVYSSVECQISIDNLTWVNTTSTLYGGCTDESNKLGYIQNLEFGTTQYIRCRNGTTNWGYISKDTQGQDNEDDKMLESVSNYAGFSTLALFVLTGLLFIAGAMKKKEEGGIWYITLGLPFLLICLWLLSSNYYMAGQSVIYNSTMAGNLSENNYHMYNIFLRIFVIGLILVISYILWSCWSWFKFKKDTDRRERGF